MTLAELERLLNSKRRVLKEEAQKRASFDYALAELIGASVARIYSKSAKFPSLQEVYPSLFDDVDAQEQKQMQKEQAFAIKLRQFAQAHNKRLKEVKDG